MNEAPVVNWLVFSVSLVVVIVTFVFVVRNGSRATRQLHELKEEYQEKEKEIQAKLQELYAKRDHLRHILKAHITICEFGKVGEWRDIGSWYNLTQQEVDSSDAPPYNGEDNERK